MFPLTNLIAGGVAGVTQGALERRGLPAPPGRLLPLACGLPGKLEPSEREVAGQRTRGSRKAWTPEFVPAVTVTDD